MGADQALRSRMRTWGLGVVFTGMVVTAVVAQPQSKDWPMFGRDLANTASTTDNDITLKNVGELAVKWVLTTSGDVSARAAVVKDVAYFPDWGPVLDPANPAVTGSSTLWAVAAGNGKVVWSQSLSGYGLSGSFTGHYHARTTPAVVGNTLYLGTQEGAWLLAINTATGALLWKTQLEASDPFAIISTSPSVHNGVVFTGVASIAEGGSLYGADLSAIMPRGSAVAVTAATGAIAWKTYMVPQGYSGGGVWGSHPVVDPSRDSVFVSTGNNYTNPTDPAYNTCIGGGGTPASCSAADNFVDAVVALDITTGAVKWASKLVDWTEPYYADGTDDWNVDCLWPILGFPGPGPQCPAGAGPDYDFGSAPNLITYRSADGPKTILGAGQKSGIYYALDPDTGATIWQTQVAPGSTLGGMEWGSASDGNRIYVQNANLFGIPNPIAPGSAGSWSALDAATGAILWQTDDPNGAVDIGPLTVANGIVYAGSMGGGPTMPTMLALDGATGQIVWRFEAGSSVNAGATVVGGTVFWGSGYAHLGFPGQTPNNKFYAFKRNKK